MRGRRYIKAWSFLGWCAVLSLPGCALSTGKHLPQSPQTQSLVCPSAALDTKIRISSRHVGINLDAITDYNPGPFVDAAKTFRAWGMAGNNTLFLPPSNLTADNYPLVNAETTSQMVSYPEGDYSVAYQGTGAVTFADEGSLVTPWTTVGSEKRATMRFKRNASNKVTLGISNVSPADPVRNLRILVPGAPLTSTTVFLPLLVNRTTSFGFLRATDWMGTNNSPVTEWSDRRLPTRFSRVGGVTYEELAELANVTAKDLWINIPAQASDDFVQNFADFLLSRIDFDAIAVGRLCQHISEPFTLYVEFSNEVWNNAYTQQAYLLSQAQLDPLSYDGIYDNEFGPASLNQNGRDVFSVSQYSAARLARIASIFRNEFRTKSKEQNLKFVMAGWASAPNFTDVGLKFVENRMHMDPSTVFDYVGLAPYFTFTGDSSNLPVVFASAAANIQSVTVSQISDFSKLGSNFNLPLIGYGGGQGFIGSDNLSARQIAQYDRRMNDLYQEFFAVWRQGTSDAPFAHYSLASPGGANGFWGLLDTLDEDVTFCGDKNNLRSFDGTEDVSLLVGKFCPKWYAINQLIYQSGY